MERKTRKYTNEFKQESVNLALKSPSVSKTASDLGIPIPTLHSWIHQFKNALSLLPLLERNKNKCPSTGFIFNTSETSMDNVSIDFLMSTGCV